jgi:hypothetical protein
MANSLDIQVLEEGPRNIVVKLTGVLDTSDAQELPAVTMKNFRDNEPCANLTGLRVDLIEYSIGQGIEIQLAWNSNSPQQITPIAGRGRIVATNYGGFVPDKTRSGYDGNINLTTTGYQAGTVQNFSVILELIKLYTV